MKNMGNINWDILGLSASFLCAIHCTLIPVLLVVFPLMTFGFLEHHTSEYIFIGISVLIAFIAIWRGYYYKHHNVFPVIIYALAVSLFVLGFLSSQAIEKILHILGGIAIVISHLYNWKYGKVFKKIDTVLKNS